ncbi:hypothetical protein [Klebsiella pneumoniae]|uniref:hypothetical protein n=1 Tax=Klebsiella pneumoniae TaxID=573 RepID=UPI0010DA9840|nr:hypothetical protein [Klebsiella pneumoniae]MDW6050675.1 hypothetical protein [Klebsiella pneumoniae]RZM71017.1 hypothetical protein C1456_22210 [Klebsiella pneumoniae]
MAGEMHEIAPTREGVNSNVVVDRWLSSASESEHSGIYGHSRFCNTDFDDKLACLNLSGV